MYFNLQKLKFERLSRNITADQAGGFIGITGNGFYKKENGKSKLSVDELSHLFRGYNIPVERIVDFFDSDVETNKQ